MPAPLLSMAVAKLCLSTCGDRFFIEYEDRLRITETLEELAAWAKANPPEHTHLKVSGLPEFTSRNNSGIEDISITILLEES